MIRKMKTVWLVGLLALALGCDPGSTISAETRGADSCLVDMESNIDGFRVVMTLRCSGASHSDCYEIAALRCQGQDKALAAPAVIATCPGTPGYCLSSCADGEQNGNLWDIPELLAIDGCNTYEDGS